MAFIGTWKFISNALSRLFALACGAMFIFVIVGCHEKLEEISAQPPAQKTRVQRIDLPGGQILLAAPGFDMDYVVVDSERLPNLKKGNFRLLGQKQGRLVIQGKVSEFVAEDFDLQIFIEENSTPIVNNLKKASHIEVKSAVAIQVLSKPISKKRVVASLASTTPADIPISSEKLPSPPKDVVSASAKPVLHYLEAFAQMNFTQLKADDLDSKSSASLATEKDLLIGARWRQDWGTQWGTYQGVSFRTLEFASSKNSNRILSERSKQLTAISLGVDYRFSRHLKFAFALSHGQELFVRGLNSVEVTVDSLAITTPEISFSHDIFERAGTSISWGGAVATPLSSSGEEYSVSSGVRYQAYLGIRKQIKEKFFEAKLGYQSRGQDTSLGHQDESNIFGQIIYSIPIFQDGQE